MDAGQKQGIVLAVTIGGAVLVLVIAMAFSGDESVVSRSATRKPFVAREDSMRDNARMLTSRNRDMDVPKGAGDGGGVLDMESASISPTDPNAGDEEELAEEEQVAQAALNALDPEEGILVIEQHLDSVETDAESSRLYSTMALLHVNADPPRPEEALAAAATAAKLAQTPEDQDYAVLVEANALHRQGDSKAAREQLKPVLERETPVTLSGLELGVMLGNLEAEAGDVAGAEAAYVRVVERAPAAVETLGVRALDVYRQACLKLARIYRADGRDADAKKLIRTMQNRLELAAP